MTKDDVIQLLEQFVEKAGGQSALARKFNVTPQQIHDVLSGYREPGSKLLASMGLRKAVNYEWIQEPVKP